MKRYVLITNIWGRQADKYQGWNYKNPGSNPLVCDSEKTEFDTPEEAREHIALFEELCNTYDKAPRRDHFKWMEKHYDANYVFETPTQRVWGWLLGDRKTMNMVWGGEKLMNYDSRTDKRILKDILFRGPDEIPKDYVWHDGEYEGWLQFRWGDGKNAIGYVEKPSKPRVETATDMYNEFTRDKYEDIEDQYAKKEEKELEKILENRW